MNKRNVCFNVQSRKWIKRMFSSCSFHDFSHTFDCDIGWHVQTTWRWVRNERKKIIKCSELKEIGWKRKENNVLKNAPSFSQTNLIHMPNATTAHPHRSQRATHTTLNTNSNSSFPHTFTHFLSFFLKLSPLFLPFDNFPGELKSSKVARYWEKEREKEKPTITNWNFSSLLMANKENECVFDLTTPLKYNEFCFNLFPLFVFEFILFKLEKSLFK